MSKQELQRTELAVASSDQFPEFRRHSLHRVSVGEIHSRPFPEYSSNRVIFHYAFMSDAGSSVANAVLAELCRIRGETVPMPEVRYHQIPWNNGQLRWESHSEFSTFTFDAKAPRSFLGEVANHPFGNGFTPPGSMMSATRIEIRPLTAASRKLLDKFDQESLTVTRLDDGESLLATDFRQDVNGMTVFLLLESKIGASRIGSLTKTIIELDTYRVLTMLGLPLARSLSSRLSQMEVELSRLTSEMKDASADISEKLLSKINGIAAELESDAAASLFRFGASKAYGSIVAERLETLGNNTVPGGIPIGSYLNRSIPPALRTCASVEQRQANLSRKLARIANLLRTKVEIEIENQNRNLLASMDKRTQLQYRLQQTVEGLSVAAVSYYVVGLFYYVSQALSNWLPLGITPKVAAGMFVPVAIFAIWFMVRSIR
ncbi:MAG: DUF3422 family protein, partial [Salaquimonas sp.]